MENIEPPEALGQSEAFLAFQERLSRVAPIERPVVLVGERGTGKELAATRLHFLSRRWRGPFVTLNCAALSPTLIESELFGFERGAFTGAERRRSGRFETASGGTLFLDELGAVPAEAQEKILRVVEYQRFERVGSSRSVAVDVRIVGATNADLPALAARGRFKQDLLDRLSFEVLFLPPLRERRGDIRYLAEYFARRMAMELGREAIPVFDAAAARELESWPWPGNVRELKNVVERAVYRADADRVAEIIFDPFQPETTPRPVERPSPESPAPADGPAAGGKSLPEAVRRLEIAEIRREMAAAGHNRRRAARRLGLTYDQLRNRLRKYAAELA